MIIVYLLVLMVLTPLVLEWFNKTTAMNGKAANILKGLPVFTANLLICLVFGAIACILPKSTGFSFTFWIVFTALIFLGNQIVFNFFIKMIAKYRDS